MTMPSADNRYIAETRAWVERAVIGLKLCPFARAPQLQGLVRYVASSATTSEALRDDLVHELQRLAACAPGEIETTLLIHPDVLPDFHEYNDFLDVAEQAVEALGLEGVIQVASFHPRYQFAGTDIDDIGNASNRSPFPTLHLLREESIERAVEAFGDTDAIFEANIETLERLGPEGWAALQRLCREDADAALE
jgi:hypothetical protein